MVSLGAVTNVYKIMTMMVMMVVIVEEISCDNNSDNYIYLRYSIVSVS